MKNFLKKSSVLILVGLVFITFCSMTYNKNDDATIIAEEPDKATKIETVQQAQDVLKKSEETKINYLIACLLALQGQAKNVHYNTRDYGIHLFADRVQEEIDGFMDELKEN